MTDPDEEPGGFAWFLVVIAAVAAVFMALIAPAVILVLGLFFIGGAVAIVLSAITDEDRMSRLRELIDYLRARR